MGKVLNIANIQGIPSFGDCRCWICGRLSRLFRIFTCKSRENMDLDLATIAMQFNMLLLSKKHPLYPNWGCNKILHADHLQWFVVCFNKMFYCTGKCGTSHSHIQWLGVPSQCLAYHISVSVRDLLTNTMGWLS